MRVSALLLAAFTASFIPLVHSTQASGHASNYSTWMALSIMYREQGVLASSTDVSALLQAGFTQKAFTRLMKQYPHANSTQAIAQYIARSVDSVVGPVGNALQDITYPMDRLSSGNGLIDQYVKTQNDADLTSLMALRESINLNTRNANGGMWYYVYKNFSYLDGMYSLAPFYTSYTTHFDAYNRSAIADMMLQLDLLWTHCTAPNDTGLLVHGYDASKTAVWADPVSGASPHVWGRSLGWYTMALIDTLELLPREVYPKEWALLLTRFSRLASAVSKAVDAYSGAWWQLLDQPGRSGNYIESSGSAMFVYSLFKGVRLGYLDNRRSGFTDVAARAYEYIVDTFVVNNGNGTLGYNGTVSVCSLNSTATYEYYVGQPINYNSVLGSAAFILASLEYESARSL
ncbi:Six-hairpin glycosidase-like protein [Favolaschia claudopus]|uniref:Six-hairpin glycosidase-like protein n=1 Tax=Favolaschia claudopus TaxID=2862362 RepID=A0AAW0DSX0_9AGAR